MTWGRPLEFVSTTTFPSGVELLLPARPSRHPRHG